MNLRLFGRYTLVFLVAGVLLPLSAAQAQLDSPLGGAPSGLFGPGGGQEGKPVQISAQFTDGSHGPARLFVTATMDSGWHIYSITQTGEGPVRTEIRLEKADHFRTTAGFRASPPADKKVEPLFDNLTVETHEDSVAWYAPIELAAGVDPATLKIKGSVWAQPCNATMCLPPQAFPFVAGLGPGVKIEEPANEQPAAVPPAGAAPPGSPGQPGEAAPQGPPQSPAPAPRGADSESAERGSQSGLAWQPYTTFKAFQLLLGDSFDPDTLKRNVDREFATSGLAWIIVLGFAGGLLLNLMPCVLPVIGLKVLSFVEQSGHDRRRALMLNIWYAAGLLSVFLVLATLAAFLKLGWGALFTYSGFNIVLAAVVFAMALSFLGVWEIPIPGFVGSGRAADLAQKEGLSGAFAKGAITTVLATPCTGPFMGTALAWAVSQPPAHIYAVFASVGLGMASPYLLIGAFPGLVRFLPKPGAWMETFKMIMGFVLLGTVVYIFTFLQWAYVVPTIGLLFTVWAASWWIGRTPAYADLQVRLRGWLVAAAFVGVAWILLFPGIDEIVPGRLAFGGLHDVMQSRFDEKLVQEQSLHLERLKAEGFALVQTGQKEPLPVGPKTVLVDITANWCLVCKTLEATVLNTQPVIDLVEQNGVVAVKADWTDESPEVTRLMDQLGAAGVPVVAVFSAKDPNRPTAVFRGAYTQERLLEALREAGPSPPEPTLAGSASERPVEILAER